MFPLVCSHLQQFHGQGINTYENSYVIGCKSICGRHICAVFSLPATNRKRLRAQHKILNKPSQYKAELSNCDRTFVARNHRLHVFLVAIALRSRFHQLRPLMAAFRRLIALRLRMRVQRHQNEVPRARHVGVSEQLHRRATEGVPCSKLVLRAMTIISEIAQKRDCTHAHTHIHTCMDTRPDVLGTCSTRQASHARICVGELVRLSPIGTLSKLRVKLGAKHT